MRISKIVCDGCGKEIHGEPIHVYAERVDRENGDNAAQNGEILYASDKDLCDECFESVKNLIDTVIFGKQVEPKPAVEEPATVEEPTPIEESTPTEEPAAIEEPAPVEKPEPSGKKKKESKAPTIRDLVLQGLSQEEVCRKTGCTPLTYQQTKYQLKKKGLLPKEEEKPSVKCSEVHDSCMYAGNKELMCDYIGATGKMRGCPAEACTKYVNKQEKQ